MPRRIEWVGDPSPYADPAVQWAMATGNIRPDDLRLVRRIERERQARLPGVTIRELTPADGFSKRYQFGPHPSAFVQLMEDADVARLAADPIERTRFRDRDELVIAIR